MTSNIADSPEAEQAENEQAECQIEVDENIDSKFEELTGERERQIEVEENSSEDQVAETEKAESPPIEEENTNLNLTQKESKVNESDIEFWSTDELHQPVDFSLTQKATENNCIELEETNQNLEYSLTQSKRIELEAEKQVFIEDSFADDEEEAIQFDRTLCEEDKALNKTLTEENSATKMDDDDVILGIFSLKPSSMLSTHIFFILVNSDDDENDVEILTEENANSNHISETAFVVVDDSILLETSSSSSILPQIDFCSKSLNDSSSDNSFKKYGKRKSISVENLTVESENKVMKLDDDVVVVDDAEGKKGTAVCIGLNNHLNDTRSEIFNEDANYGKLSTRIRTKARLTFLCLQTKFGIISTRINTKTATATEIKMQL